jgi:hypothetical protein
LVVVVVALAGRMAVMRVVTVAVAVLEAVALTRVVAVT